MSVAMADAMHVVALQWPNGTNPNVLDFKNIAPFYLNETFAKNWFRILNSYSLVDLLGDIGQLFLFHPHPQLLGATYNGESVPFNVTMPTSSEAIGCLGATLLASGAPDEAEPVVQALDALQNLIFAPVLGGAGCNIKDYALPGGKSYYVASGEDANGGSGSGITHFVEFHSQTVKPIGESAGDPTR